MLISLIVAMAANRCIGREGQLPWHLPGDLQRFKQLTMGHCLLMGRKTFDSLGTPLPGRPCYILSRNPEFAAHGCHTFSDLRTAIAAVESTGETELFICGGEEIYHQALPLCARIYLTELKREVDGDRFFPEIPTSQFRAVRQLLLAESEPYTFTEYDKRSSLVTDL